MPVGDVLWQRLKSARDQELQKLGEIMGLANVKAKPHEVLVEELSREIRAAAGHSLVNFFRGPHHFAYKEMLIDVANKLAPGLTFLSWTPYKVNDRHTEIEVEETIWGYFEERMEATLKSLPPEKREKLRQETKENLKKLGFSDAMVTQIGAALVAGTTATVVAPALAYSVALNAASGLAWVQLWWAGQATAAAVLGAGAGVFGVIYAPVLLWYLGSTAFRKTVPAALQLIQIRKLQEIEATLG